MLSPREPTQTTASDQAANRARRRGAIVILTLIALLLSSTAPISAQDEISLTLTGWFSIIWVDGDPSSGAAHEHLYFLTDDLGQQHQLDVSRLVATDLLRLQGKRVTIQGARSSSDVAPQSTFTVSSMQADVLAQSADATTASVTGNKPYITILCKFPDVTLDGSITRAQAEQDAASATSFWQAASYDRVTFAGSRALGWVELPNPKSYYIYDKRGSGRKELDLDRAIRDCTATIDPIIYFPAFSGINTVFNVDRLSEPIGPSGIGGGYVLTIDGQTRWYGATWNIGRTSSIYYLLAHEIGHSLGLPHSSGPYGQVYDSPWDVMSGGGGTIAFHKDLLSWIPSSRKLIVPNGTRTITLSRLAAPVTGDLLMAQIPISGSSDRFYTVEYRYKYDDLGNAVVIHEVDRGRFDSAHVIDVDNNGNVRDSGSWWTPGEMFVNAANGVRVCVLAIGPDSAQVSIALNSALSCIPPQPGPFLIANLRNLKSGCTTDANLNCIDEVRRLRLTFDYLGGAPSPISTTVTINLSPELVFKQLSQPRLWNFLENGTPAYIIAPVITESTRLVFDLPAIGPGLSIYDSQIEFSVPLTITTTSVLTAQVEISGTNGIVSGTTFFITNPLSVYAPVSPR